MGKIFSSNKHSSTCPAYFEFAIVMLIVDIASRSRMTRGQVRSELSSDKAMSQIHHLSSAWPLEPLVETPTGSQI